MSEILFQVDTKHRKQWFTGLSFSHPAKMSLPLQLWLIDKFTKENETILDPMAGSGTLMVCCSLGRNCILVELEDKFCKMMEANWEKVKQRGCQLGYSMGTCQILQGDARNLTGILADKCIFSPPYAETRGEYNNESFIAQISDEMSDKYKSGKIRGHGGSKEAFKRAWNKRSGFPPDAPDNIANLPYGNIDKIITSPPFAGNTGGLRSARGFKYGDDPVGERMMGGIKGGTGENPNNIDHLPYGSIDAVISSPPYEGTEPFADKVFMEREGKAHYTQDYLNPNTVNIGNLKSTSYLGAMLAVYQQCFAVLKDGGLMILVTKDFIRNKKRIDLAGDTIKLCEQAGFQFLERHYRKLSSQSFWRVIYKQRYPDAPEITTEDILVFKKG